MTRAVAFIRKSQGGEDDVSLQLQRERVHDLASDHADEVEEVDLGVRTGFSIHMRPDSEERIDTNDKVLTLWRTSAAASSTTSPRGTTPVSPAISLCLLYLTGNFFGN